MTVHPKSPALDDLLSRFPELTAQRGELYASFELLEQCAVRGHKILICGNGGSAADADHIAGELMKSFVHRRPLPHADQEKLLKEFPDDAAGLIRALEASIPAIALANQTATLTAFANDVDYDYGFAQQVYGLGTPGDVLLALSTSGNSRNVVHACRVARIRGVGVVGLTGRSGGKLASLCDVVLRAPADETYLVQELHLPIYHALCLALEEHMFAQHGRRA
jgi:D-sedoheptulose 7-phosphate isomerase